MEEKIILEGIYVMLEENRDNMKKNPELETIKSKLATIEKACNELAGQKFVTENVLAQFLVCTLQRIMEMNEKQDEKIEKLKGYILGHHKFVKEQTVRQQENTDVRLERIENLLREKQEKQGFRERFMQWIREFNI